MGPPATHSSVNSVSGNSSTTFGGAYMGPPAAHSSVDSVSGNSSTTFGAAYMRLPAAHSSVNSASGNSSTTFGGPIWDPQLLIVQWTLFLVVVQARLEEPIPDPQQLTVQ